MIVKVCGVTSAAVALAAVDAGADWIGLVFEPGSPRFADAASADAVREAVAGRADLVGVMVETDATTCNRLAERYGLAAVQLHGEIDREMVVDVDVPVIRGINPRTAGEAFTVDWWPDATLLLDAAPAIGALPGGTGRKVDLALAADMARHHRIVLAGGLGPDNVAESIRSVRPWGVDASSGLEETRGVKNESLVRAYVEAARAAFFAAAALGTTAQWRAR